MKLIVTDEMRKSVIEKLHLVASIASVNQAEMTGVECVSRDISNSDRAAGLLFAIIEKLSDQILSTLTVGQQKTNTCASDDIIDYLCQQQLLLLEYRGLGQKQMVDFAKTLIKLGKIT